MKKWPDNTEVPSKEHHYSVFGGETLQTNEIIPLLGTHKFFSLLSIIFNGRHHIWNSWSTRFVCNIDMLLLLILIHFWYTFFKKEKLRMFVSIWFDPEFVLSLKWMYFNNSSIKQLASLVILFITDKKWLNEYRANWRVWHIRYKMFSMKYT